METVGSKAFEWKNETHEHIKANFKSGSSIWPNFPGATNQAILIPKQRSLQEDMKMILLLPGLALTMTACIREHSTLTEFVVDNHSGHELRIHVSNFETEIYSSVDTTFVLPVDSQWTHQYENDGREAVYDRPFGASSDSMTIQFNDTVYSMFDKDNPSRYNPLKIENYSGGKIKKGLYRYTYTFTQQDYLEAL